jgi:hypothetical protein
MELVINSLWMMLMYKPFYSLIILLLVSIGWSQKLVRVNELRGAWKFSIGDEMNWAKPEFNDSKWQEIYVPSSWEDEGYPGYDGYAWYRKTIEIDKKDAKKNLYLRLGFIDDVDQVYFNGKMIGSIGSFPPFYETAYNKERFYRIPDSVFNANGKNVIAVRVFDGELTGGIIKGYCGIYEKKYDVDMEISLEGNWKFKTGDNLIYKSMDYNDRHWNNIFVPETWEKQGILNYDGYAWYRKKIIIPEKLIGDKLVLLLGKIDDLDETFFNGFKIGNTGILFDDNYHAPLEGEWLVLRAYQIDNEYINFGGENVIAVRVFDGMIDGGIYQGPVGIVTFDNYSKWRSSENKETKKGFFDWLFSED